MYTTLQFEFHGLFSFFLCTQINVIYNTFVFAGGNRIHRKPFPLRNTSFHPFFFSLLKLLSAFSAQNYSISNGYTRFIYYYYLLLWLAVSPLSFIRAMSIVVSLVLSRKMWYFDISTFVGMWKEKKKCFFNYSSRVYEIKNKIVLREALPK